MLFYSKGLSHPIIVKSMQQNMFKSVQLHHVQSSSKEEIKKKTKQQPPFLILVANSSSAPSKGSPASYEI